MRRLLVVDDDPAFREYVERVAEEIGYTVCAVGDGRDVPDACRTFRPDVILIDMVLPGQDGIEVVRKLAAEATEARIVLVSGHSATYLNAARAIASAFGVESVQTAEKPLGLSVLRAMLA